MSMTELHEARDNIRSTMTVDDIELLKSIVKKMAKAVHYKSPSLKPWKDLSGVEWTQRCLEADWIKDRPKMGWWKDK